MNVGEAEIAASALDAAGIECHLADENVVGVAWNMSQAVGGVKLLVRDEDLERAQEVLNQASGLGPQAPDRALELPESEARGPRPEASVQCPECGSPDFQRVPRLRIFLLLALLFIGIGAAVGEELIAATGLIAVAVGALLMPTARCSVCSHRWTPESSTEIVEAPPPDPRDMIEEKCPRCGSLEVYRLQHRRLKAIPLLINTAIFAIVPIWLFMPRRQCDACGLRF